MAKKATANCCYFIGDVHGCHAELLALEKKIQKHASQKCLTPFFVCVGDLIDRGPKSLEVVHHFRDSVAAGTHAVVAGNHEQMFFDLLSVLNPVLFNRILSHSKETPQFLMPLQKRFQRDHYNVTLNFDEFVARMKDSWLRQGGRQTLASFGMADLETPSVSEDVFEALVFLFGLPLIWESDSVVVTHALGFPEDIQYAHQVHRTGLFEASSHEHMLHVENILWNRDLPNFPLSTKLHISGHTPLTTPIKHTKQNAIQIDTGCVYGNCLTAYCQATDEFIFVNAGTI